MENIIGKIIAGVMLVGAVFLVVTNTVSANKSVVSASTNVSALNQGQPDNASGIQISADPLLNNAQQNSAPQNNPHYSISGSRENEDEMSEDD